MKWEPIETVLPCRVIVWDRSCGYNIVEGDDYNDRHGGPREFFNGDAYVDATHWMPLPDPPE